MEEIASWEAYSHLISQDFSYLLQNPKFYYHVHKCLILNQMNPAHILTLYFLTELYKFDVILFNLANT